MIDKIKHVHDTLAYQYAISVLEEKVKTGRFIKLAAERFIKDLKRDDIYLDLDIARKVVNFPELVKHWKGSLAGHSIELNPHQAFYFQQLFGWKHIDTNLRRFKRSAKFVARKNGKTTELAIQSLFHVSIEKQHGPQVWIGATKKDQAKILLLDVGRFIEGSDDLKEDYRIYRNKGIPTTINHVPTNGIINVIGRDSDREDGLDVSMSLIDEWHAHPDSAIRDILSSAMGNRSEPLESIISTAGFNLQGPAYTKTRKTGIDILEGVKEDDQQLIIFYEMDNYELWEDEREWVCANPQFDYVSTLYPELKSEFVRAKNEGGTTEVNFKTKHLNIWMNSSETWMDLPTIRKNNHGIREEELIGRECYCGLDLSGGVDLNAFALFFPNVRDGIHAIKVMFWIPRDKMDKRKDEVDYYAWSQDGWVRVFDGNTVEYDVIAHEMVEEMNKYEVKSIGVDPAYFATGPASHLKETGYLERIMTVTQSYTNLTAPTTQLETWMSQGKIEFFGNPVLEWNFSNVVLAMGTSSGKMPSKGKSADKIDGVAAIIDAVFECLRLKGEVEKEFFVLGV